MNYDSLFPRVSSFLNMKKKILFAVCMLIPFCLFLRQVDAHKVSVFAYAQEGKVYAEGYFVDGSKAKNSVIEIVDGKTGETLLEKKTDDNGRISFAIPRITALKLILHAGAGHQNEYILTEEEVRDAMPAAKKQIERQPEQRKKEEPLRRQAKSEQPAGGQTAMLSPISSEEMKAVVEKVVDSKLQPVMKILVELQEKSGKPKLTEILGGIGYIIGIMGVVAYFKGRGTNR